MKKVILISLIIYPLSFIIVLSSYAASPSPTVNSEAQINELKDRIASRVAQLNLVEKRGIIGIVTDTTDTQITLTDVKGDTRFVDVDELTKFDGTAASGSFGISDVKKGSTLGVLGLYNKQSGRILARTVEELAIPKMIHGNIATIDLDNYILNVATDKNEQLQVEFETTTKSFSYDRTNQQLIKSGFSKIKTGESIFVVGFMDKTVKDKIDADRIIVLPDIIKGPSVQITPTIIPSTGSGKILIPIVK